MIVKRQRGEYSPTRSKCDVTSQPARPVPRVGTTYEKGIDYSKEGQSDYDNEGAKSRNHEEEHFKIMQNGGCEF